PTWRPNSTPGAPSTRPAGWPPRSDTARGAPPAPGPCRPSESVATFSLTAKCLMLLQCSVTRRPRKPQSNHPLRPVVQERFGFCPLRCAHFSRPLGLAGPARTALLRTSEPGQKRAIEPLPSPTRHARPAPAFLADACARAQRSKEFPMKLDWILWLASLMSPQAADSLCLSTTL